MKYDDDGDDEDNDRDVPAYLSEFAVLVYYDDAEDDRETTAIFLEFIVEVNDGDDDDHDAPAYLSQYVVEVYNDGSEHHRYSLHSSSRFIAGISPSLSAPLQIISTTYSRRGAGAVQRSPLECHLLPLIHTPLLYINSHSTPLMQLHHSTWR